MAAGIFREEVQRLRAQGPSLVSRQELEAALAR
jgi:hypothetical protein